jgi:hypothetical protein
MKGSPRKPKSARKAPTAIDKENGGWARCPSSVFLWFNPVEG